MIYISNVEKIFSKEKVRLKADLSISPSAAEKWYEASQNAMQYKDASFIVTDYLEHISDIQQIWFETDISYEKGVCSDRGDAFIVAMLFYAMITEEDIICEAPVSSKLLFHLNDYLIPLLSFQSSTRKISIQAPTIGKPDVIPKAVGTGMSCGIDSMASLYEYRQKNIPEEYRLTHLTFFNVGADKGYVPKHKKWNDLSKILEPFNKTMEEKKRKAERIANELSLGFVFVDSNQTLIYQGLFEESHLYRSMSAVMFLQNFFSVYYLSSTGCLLDDFEPKLRIDPGHYEIGMVPYLSTENLQFECGSKAYNRVEKMRMIQDDQITQRYLNVCSDITPCYHCTKDFRMIIIFDILNCEEKFKHIYSIEKNHEVRWKAYNWLLKSRKNDSSAKVLWDYVKEQRIKIPIRSYIKYYIWYILKILKMRN